MCEKRDHVEIIFFWDGPSQYSAAADSCPAHFSFTLSLSFFDPPAKCSMVVLRPAMLLTSSSLRELHGRIHARTQSQLYPSARTHARSRPACVSCLCKRASEYPTHRWNGFVFFKRVHAAKRDLFFPPALLCSAAAAAAMKKERGLETTWFVVCVRVCEDTTYVERG